MAPQRTTAIVQQQPVDIRIVTPEILEDMLNGCSFILDEYGRPFPKSNRKRAFGFAGMAQSERIRTAQF